MGRDITPSMTKSPTKPLSYIDSECAVILTLPTSKTANTLEIDHSCHQVAAELYGGQHEGKYYVRVDIRTYHRCNRTGCVEDTAPFGKFILPVPTSDKELHARIETTLCKPYQEPYGIDLLRCVASG